MEMPEMPDDKAQVIWAVVIIVIAAMFKVEDSAQIVTAGLSGLFGLAVGKSLK